jgi:hypothetical protein
MRRSWRPVLARSGCAAVSSGSAINREYSLRDMMDSSSRHQTFMVFTKSTLWVLFSSNPCSLRAGGDTLSTMQLRPGFNDGDC